MLRGAISLEAGGKEIRLSTFHAFIKKKKPKTPQTSHPMGIKGYRAKIKQGSVNFWHVCALS